jgi:glutamate synthase domain-containing protein 1
MLFGMPDSFMRSKAKEIFGIDLPKKGEYAVANVFLAPKNDQAMAVNKARMERLAKERGMKFIGWRSENHWERRPEGD